MATPSGAISFEDIRTEFGQPQANNSLNNYYSGGPALGAPLGVVPSSGAISMSQLKIIEKTSGAGNQVNIASGVPNGTHLIYFTNNPCYSNSTGAAAISVPSGRTAGTTLVIGHGIAGKGGNGGAGQEVEETGNTNFAFDTTGTGTAGDGSAGGTALSLNSPTHLDNNSTIRAGSGGGGGGSAFGAPKTGYIDNGIACETTNLKGIISTTNGSTEFTIGTGGSGGGGGNSNITNNADGSGGGPGGGGHQTNFTSTAVVAGNPPAGGVQCSANSSFSNQGNFKMIANGNAGGVPGGGGSGFGGNTNGRDGGSDGNAGASGSAANGTTNFPTVSANGASVSQLSGVGGDGASGGAAGTAIAGWNSHNTTIHGIASSQGTYTGGIS